MEQSVAAMWKNGYPRRMFTDLVLRKEVDRSSPVFIRLCTQGQRIRRAVLTVRKAQRNAFEHVKMIIDECVVVSFSHKGDGDDVVEELGLRLGKFRYAYIPQRPDGKPAPTIEMAWSILLNRGTFQEKTPVLGNPTPKPSPEEVDRFSIKLVDEAGRPFSDVFVTFVSKGQSEGSSTNSAGVAHYIGPAQADTVATIPAASAKKMADTLASRADAPPKATPGALAGTLSEEMAELALKPGQTTTVVVSAPQKETNAFEVVAYDAWGKELSGVPLSFEVDGKDPGATTDDAGSAWLRGAAGASGTVSVADYEALVDALTPRWTSPPAEEDRKAVEDAVEVVVRKQMDPIPITAGKRTKVVFTRKVVRVRLIGMHGRPLSVLSREFIGPAA